MNKAILLGRLTRDPEANVYNEKKKVSFSIAVQRSGKNAPADFFNCQAWDKTAELVELHFKKGKQILVEGQIRTDSYTNREDKKVTVTYILVDRVYFVGNREDNAADPKPQPKPEPKQDDPYVDETPNFKQLDLDALDGELPFI